MSTRCNRTSVNVKQKLSLHPWFTLKSTAFRLDVLLSFPVRNFISSFMEPSAMPSRKPFGSPGKDVFLLSFRLDFNQNCWLKGRCLLRIINSPLNFSLIKINNISSRNHPWLFNHTCMRQVYLVPLIAGAIFLSSCKKNAISFVY